MTENAAAKSDPEAVVAPGATPPASDDDWERQKLADAETMRKLLDQDSNGQVNILPEEYMNADYRFDQSGKADDAEDFEDISDDDLPEEEETAGTQTASAELPGLTDDGGTSNDNDDLWGEGEGDGDADLGPSSPLIGAPSSPPAEPVEDADADTMDTSPDLKEREDSAPYKPSDFDINFPTADYSLNQDPSIPAVAQTELELVKSVWPTFDTGTQFDWNRLLPPKRATWVGKKPTRAPKPLAPTKLSLDLDVDQEKTFRVPGPAAGTTRQKIRDAEAKGLVSCLVPEPIEEADITIFSRELDDDNETVGGFTLADIETICFDFESMIDAGQPISPPLTPTLDAHADDEDDWDKMFLDSQPAAKRRKFEVERGLPRIPRFVAPSFDQFEEATARAAKRVHLDFADPHLLIEEQTAQDCKLNNNSKAANGRLGRNAQSRFNFANDEQYENLKLNHKHKVRATIGNMAVEHSIPAIKLLWPYYSVKPEAIQPYDYHRPLLQTNKGAGDWVRFAQPTKRKRKIEKNRKVQETFSSSKDLTLNDNSYVVLFEYSEQIPTVLSKFGMGNKIVNHARKRTNIEDESSVVDKKTYELGEENILTTEDKSPFSTFGRVEQGEVVPTLTNAMYHAPIFKHQPRKTDFILGRSTTGKEGPFYYLRKMDHLYVVGQNFPSMEVPGPHSRKVTTLSKNRMKMIAYRLIHSKGAVELPEMTKHVKGSTDPQNRQKLKEFLSYDKNIKAWKIKESDTLLDKDSIDKMIKPEDVCLNDAHQVGAGELLINGYTVSKVEETDHDLDDGNEQSFAKSMSPWNTTKAFIDACAGKAMVRLRGPGDPTGHGLGFSFIKTSMKGGYMEALQKDRGPGNTANDAMTIEAQRKDASGHSYNVKQQEELYNKEIGEIWTKQKMTLSDPMEHDDEDMQKMDDEDDRFYGNANFSANASFAQSGNFGGSQAPASSIVPPTPGGVGGSTVIDDKTSVFSRRSATEIGGASGIGSGRKKMLKIYRRMADGSEETVEMVFDEKVMKRYIDQRREARSNEIDVFSENIGFTNDEEYNAAMIQRINQEQARLIRNKERRLQREKSKNKLGPSTAAARASTPSGGPNDPDSPAPSIEKGAGAPAGGTSRKCANCGQVGHIKTNKKYRRPFYDETAFPLHHPGNVAPIIIYYICRRCILKLRYHGSGNKVPSSAFASAH